jgi:hypothetical protein
VRLVERQPDVWRLDHDAGRHDDGVVARCLLRALRERRARAASVRSAAGRAMPRALAPLPVATRPVHLSAR